MRLFFFFNLVKISDIAKYEKAVHAEKLKSGQIPDKEEFKKKNFKEERDFFIKKIEEMRETKKKNERENFDLFKSGKIDKTEFDKRATINRGVVEFFQEKLKRVEHDLWIMNKNKYDPIKFPIYY